MELSVEAERCDAEVPYFDREIPAVVGKPVGNVVAASALVAPVGRHEAHRRTASFKFPFNDED